MNWDLSKLYKDGFDDAALYADIEFSEGEAEAIAALLRSYDPASEPAASALAVIRRFEALYAKAALCGSFVMLTLAVDGTNERALKLMDRIMKCQMAFDALSSAFKSLMGKIPDMDALISSEPRLQSYSFMMREAAKAAKHVIDPALEPTVLKMRLTGSSAWAQLRDMLDSTHMVDIRKDGETVKIPLSAARNMAYSPDPDVRKSGYEAEIASYPKIEQAMAACLNGLKGEALTMFELTNYSNPVEQTLDGYRMDKETLDALLDVMQESLPHFRRYFKAKAKALGHENGLPFYDLFAPMGESGKRFTVDQAKSYLLEVLGQFSGKMAAFVERAFDESWIDMFPKEGKGGGAFCAGIHPLQLSYILTNFDGSLSDVSTLAHELGHAYHNECMKDESIFNADAPMPLAETASIFNETLLTGTALKTATPDEEIMLIDAELTDAAQTVVDILSRYLFESEVFARRSDHALTVSELKEIMLDAQRKTYGDGLDESCLHPYMWACKSHYYRTDTHFYNFPYAFGLLFGKGVYAQYLEKGDAFLPLYDELLKRTGSDSIAGAASSVGINVRDKAFWRSSMAQVIKKIDRFVELTK